MSKLEKGAAPLGLPYVKIGLRRNRADLSEAIEHRVDRMIGAGLVEEVRHLVEMGHAGSAVVRNTLGYKEILLHLDGRVSLAEASDLIKKNTRSFAKRQMTWFGKETDIRWLGMEKLNDLESTVSEVCRSYDLTSGA
jgi:tRNA dimethylallyltransferase